MKISKVLLLCIVLIACDTNSNSFSQSDLTPEMIVEKFFILYDSEGSDSALDFITSTNRWIVGGSSEMKNSFQELTNQMGNYQGNEFIVKRSIGENYLLWSYLVKYDRQPIRFNFIFYRPSKTWQLQDFRYDDDLDTELIEAANVYRLMENLPGNNQ